jgi:V8-like Glu-specific endopeptidase
MNRHLSAVGTAGAVAHIDEHFRDALLEQRVSRIETCDHARAFVRLNSERQEVLPITAFDPPAGAEYAPEPVDAEDELVDKIINGTAFDHASTVGITVGSGGTCTGNLISATTLVTAGHCLPITQGFSTVRAWIQTGATRTCISHATVNNDCPTGQPENAFIARHPNYAQGDGWDQGVVIINPGWRAPANTSARWTRFAANWGLPLIIGLNSNPVRIAGYGLISENGTFGSGRRGNSTHNIAWMNEAGTFFHIPRVSAASSATCRGDSGSGPYNTSLTSNNIMLGIHRGPTLGNFGNCTNVGQSMVYSVPDGTWIRNNVVFFNGACTEESVSGTPVLRCW